MSDYEVDLLGTLPANVISSQSGELHSLYEGSHANYQHIIPKHAPFYAYGFLIEKKVDQIWSPMTLNKDYAFASYHGQTSALASRPVYGSVIISEEILKEASNYRIMFYRTFGGAWADNTPEKVKEAITLIYQGFSIPWDRVNGNHLFQTDSKPHTLPSTSVSQYGQTIVSINEASNNINIADNIDKMNIVLLGGGGF